MAHASIVSLMNILDRILHGSTHVEISYTNRHENRFFISRDGKRQIGSLYIKLSLLLDFLEKSSQRQRNEEGKSLEIKIIDVTCRTEDEIESGIFDPFYSESQGPLAEIFSDLSRKRHASEISMKLQNIIEEINSITEEMVRVKNGSGEHNPQQKTSLPSKSAPRGQTTIVGFDVDLMQIKDGREW